MVRQSVYSLLVPGMRTSTTRCACQRTRRFDRTGSPKRWDRGTRALHSDVAPVRDRALTQEENLVGLRAVNRALLAQRPRGLTRADRIVLDMDSSGESGARGAGSERL